MSVGYDFIEVNFENNFFFLSISLLLIFIINSGIHFTFKTLILPPPIGYNFCWTLLESKKWSNIWGPEKNQWIVATSIKEIYSA
jgi:hypothetical protein